ncbi:gluconolaconase [Devosia pacifica]|uniref:Gluconolaconase n=1 Tax=Devosia pacifica TaxID=1335967 RepID=A0A918RRY9_9HYPH|nr:SMP-30/gluconolactonase/LRE family protein [Devosia pacifica]GHA10738.1 gluconolaconase [Devosia pacifica]
MSQAQLLIDCQCGLGEGPFWHPDRQELFWFDIDAQRLFAADENGEIRNSWAFPESAAAAAIIDADTLAIATETGLKRLDLKSGEISLIVEIEADDPKNRANDSRVHPSGAFWIGTMRKEEDAAAGNVYHYRAGAVNRIISNVKIPNATCFTPDGTRAYFADTPTGRIMTTETDPDTGMPTGEWKEFADCRDHRGSPDGAVVDSEGYVWSARWGGHCVVRHAPDGSVDRIVEVPASQVTCPAFGGKDLKTLYVTTARKTLSDEQMAAEPHAGGIFAINVDVAGQTEPRLAL